MADARFTQEQSAALLTDLADQLESAGFTPLAERVRAFLTPPVNASDALDRALGRWQAEGFTSFWIYGAVDPATGARPLLSEPEGLKNA